MSDYVEVSGRVNPECLIVNAGIGMATTHGEPSERQAAIEAEYGPVFMIMEIGVHDDGDTCQTIKLLAGDTAGALYGMLRVLIDELPVHQRDQLLARAHQTAKLLRDKPKGQ